MEKTIKIKGMTCNNCKIHVEKALNSLDGVKAEVNLENNLARVLLSKEISNETLKQAVKESGYEVTSIEV
jgi:Cu+-exporting ATPase